MLCSKCQKRGATVHFSHQVDGAEKTSLHLCQECAGPIQARLEAKRQGQQPCEFCGKAAFSPLPGASAIIYACCQCRLEYSRIFFELCARQRPELIEQSKGDIFFFEMMGDAQVEEWANAISQEAIEQLQGSKQDDRKRPNTN